MPVDRSDNPTKRSVRPDDHIFRDTGPEERTPEAHPVQSKPLPQELIDEFDAEDAEEYGPVEEAVPVESEEAETEEPATEDAEPVEPEPDTADAPEEPTPEDDDPMITGAEACKLIGMSRNAMMNYRKKYRRTPRAVPGKRNHSMLGSPYTARRSEWLEWGAKYYRTSPMAQRGFGVATAPEPPAPVELPAHTAPAPIPQGSVGIDWNEPQRRCLVALTYRWRTDDEGVLKRILQCPPAALAARVEAIEQGNTTFELVVPKAAMEVLRQRGEFWGRSEMQQIEEILKASVQLGGSWL